MRENLSQQKLLEILTHEIEVLKKTSRNINEVAPVIAERLQELKNTKLKATIDSHRLEYEIANLKSFISSRITFPAWFLVFVTILIGILVIQSLWLYYKVFGG